MKRILGNCLLAVLTVATTAHADAIDDVWRGTNLRFIHAQARLDGETFTAGDWLIPKPAGTLNITVPLTHLGISHPDSVRLTGVRSGSNIVWTFNQSLSPPLISGDTHIERLSGQLVAQARLVPGSATPTCGGAACAYNVLLTPGPGSSIHVEGCQYVWPACWGFSKDIEVRTFRGFGGLPRPQLASVALDLPGSRCASTSTTYASGVVTLRSQAPSGGAAVDLRSTAPSHVQVRPVRVPAGARTARFTVAISPSWTGSAQIVASAGGIVGMALVNRQACYALLHPSVLQLLSLGGRPFGLLTNGQVLFHGATGAALFDPKSQKSRELSSLLGLDAPTVIAHTPNGELLGTAKKDASTVAFVWNVLREGAQVYEGVQPVGINPLGLALARDLKSPGEWRVLDEAGVRPASKLQSLTLSRAAGNSSGRFAVGLLSGQKLLPALVDEESISVISQFEGEAVDTIASGMVVGHARNGQGKMQAFRWAPKQGFLWQLLPSGCGSATVTDLNEAGWFVGTADCGKSHPVPYLTDNAGKVTRLDQLAQAQGVTFVDALALSDTNTVLLRGLTSGGADIYFLLHP